ncbi:MAG: alpha/beta fold hydrolase [Burkholderiales bacterium]|jgi:pimeloyl-ACP methyl ester carboxylesterase|nr:alpha/beta fold hydrolase [Burkholderiales bacterium]
MSYVSVMRNSSPIGRVYYEDIGSSNKQVIVMQHGDGNSSEDWKSLGYVEKLSPHFRLILIDYLGYGQSDKVYDPSVYSMHLLATDTIAVLQHLDINNAIFFGGSMGARLGYELAAHAEYASFFRAFILNGMGTSENKLINAFSIWAEEGGMEKVVKEMNKYMAQNFPAAIENTFLKNDPNAYAAANKNPWPAVTEKLDRIDKPVLLICGELADELIEMKEASKIIPNAEICILSGLDHAQAYWYSDAVVPLILPFIDKLLS